MKRNKKMTVFISWSQSRSKQIATILKDTLELLFNRKIEFWVSGKDIATGAFFASTIATVLKRSQMAIICLDRSNYKKPWILFETGGVFLQNYDPENIDQAILLPIIFDNLKPEAFSGTPFHDMQLSQYNMENMGRAVHQINNMYKKVTGEYVLEPDTLTSFFEQLFPSLHDKIEAVFGQTTEEVENMITEDNVADLISGYDGFSEPAFGNVIRYEYGFETLAFYRFLLENVKNRLYIFGRKNSKLSSYELDVKYSDIINRGIDVRLLFLNPKSQLAKGRVAQNIANFKRNLEDSIIRYIERYKSLNVDIDFQCKMYDQQRDCQIVIADNVVFYKELTFTPNGKPERFTNKPFSVTSVNTAIGMTFMNKFNQVWNTESVPIPKDIGGENLFEEKI